MVGEKAFRVALLGCGRIAQVHAMYLRATPGAELVGACDNSAEARESFTRRWQVPTCATIREMLAALQPDVVHVLTPPQTHAALAIELMRAGVHVVVEKPMALSTEEADRMVQVARETGRMLTVDHNRWFDPVMVKARELLASGALGELVGVDVFCSVGPGGAEEQPWKSGLPGGPVFDSAPHAAYLAYGLAGPFRGMRTMAQWDEQGMLRELRAVLQGEKVLCHVALSACARPVANTVTLYGSRATAVVNLNHMTLVVRTATQLPKLLAKVYPTVAESSQLLWATARNTLQFLFAKQRFYPGIGGHLRALYAALSTGRDAPVRAEDGRAVVALVEELYSGTVDGSHREEAVA